MVCRGKHPSCIGSKSSAGNQATSSSMARFRPLHLLRRDSGEFISLFRETLQEYWWCTERSLDWGPGGGPDLIVDDGGDATMLIHEGVKAEEEFAKSGKLPDPTSTDNAEFQIVLSIIKEGLQSDPLKYHKMKERLVGVSEETTTGVKRLYQMQANGSLLFPIRGNHRRRR
ncbi:hypothetical protein LXL04_029941 [Taraxacum kok-saghyz]